MEIRDFVVLAYKAFDGEMHGKTKLQKRVYFLAAMLSKVEKLGYMPHYYGPFSPRVADGNSELRSLGYLEEAVRGVGELKPEGFEVARYDYTLTEAGRQLAERKKAEFPDEWESIRQKADVIKAAGDLHYMLLSAAAKFHFVLTRHGGKATFDGIKMLAGRLGWAIGENELKKAADFLQSIGLITVS